VGGSEGMPPTRDPSGAQQDIASRRCQATAVLSKPRRRCSPQRQRPSGWMIVLVSARNC